MSPDTKSTVQAVTACTVGMWVGVGWVVAWAAASVGSWRVPATAPDATLPGVVIIDMLEPETVTGIGRGR